MNTQPLVTTAAITSIVGALIALLTAFGVALTSDQTAAILGFVSVVSPWVVALVGNRFTTPLVRPTDEDGTPLVRLDDSMPTRSATRAARGA